MYPAFLPLFCPYQNCASTSSAEVLPVKGVDNWMIRRFRTASDLNNLWPNASRQDDFWLRPEALAFQLDDPQGMTTEAIVLENTRDHRRVLLTAQTFYFNAAGQVSDTAKGATSRYDLRRRLLSPFSFKVLCLGQFLTSGTYCRDGLEQLSTTEATALLPAAADSLASCGGGYATYLLKDLYPTRHPVIQELDNQGFYQLPVDPVMELDLRKEWKTMEDYLATVTSKYRVRYRRARGKLAGISRRQLTASEVDRYRDLIYGLYQKTSSGADFNAAKLTPAYFPWLARVGAAQLKARIGAPSRFRPNDLLVVAEANPETPRLQGYFNAAGELIGFTSAIPNGSVYHAHYLGLQDDYKYSHHLYHNMLFDLLEDAIAGGFHTLDYGRTALEIKSSVGAQPADYACLIKARNGLINRLVPIFTPAVYQAPEWTARNPFKAAH